VLRVREVGSGIETNLPWQQGGVPQL